MEDLREFYITPMYLETMAKRARAWSHEFIQDQMDAFQRNHPDYPELSGILEAELYRRDLNRFRLLLKKKSSGDLRGFLEQKNPSEDYREMIEIELAIRGGARHLVEKEESAG